METPVYLIISYVLCLVALVFSLVYNFNEDAHYRDRSVKRIVLGLGLTGILWIPWLCYGGYLLIDFTADSIISIEARRAAADRHVERP